MTKTSIGIDEVGRGALAGPMVVGAVVDNGLHDIVPELVVIMHCKNLRDSKKHTQEQRERAYDFLQSRLIWAVGEVSAKEIDGLGLTEAAKLASGRALAQLPTAEEIVADAGLRHPHEAAIPTQWFVKGDEHILPITLASIMAKVWRDRLMTLQANEYPQYGFQNHVGYATLEHRTAIQLHGPTELHRRSFLRNILA
jgi:ribonuclease HII